jgi:O-antigen/teichoic acid export membrane protein
MSELGLYSMAAMIAWAPFQFISSITGRIMMPAFSEKQSNKEWINKWTLNITSMIAFMGFPLLFFVIFYGRDVLTLVYGTRYGSVSVPFAIIFTTALMRTSSLPIATVYMMSGRPELQRLFTGIRALLMVTFIFPATKWFGLTGAATAGLVSMLIGFILQVRRMHKITGLETHQYYGILLRALCISSIVMFLWFLSKDLYAADAIFNIIPGVLGFIIAYGFAIKLYFRKKDLNTIKN